MPALHLPKVDRPRPAHAARTRPAGDPHPANDNERPMRERIKQLAAWALLGVVAALAAWALV